MRCLLGTQSPAGGHVRASQSPFLLALPGAQHLFFWDTREVPVGADGAGTLLHGSGWAGEHQPAALWAL